MLKKHFLLLSIVSIVLLNIFEETMILLSEFHNVMKVFTEAIHSSPVIASHLNINIYLLCDMLLSGSITIHKPCT